MLMLPLSASAYYTTVDASAYTSAEGGTLGCRGDVLQVGYVASDDLPYGTVVYIGEQRFVVMDCFGGDYSGRLDIFMESESDALEFGRKELEIYVEED